MLTRWTSGQCPACGATIAGRQPSCERCGLDVVADELAKIAYTARFLGWAWWCGLLDERAHALLRRELDAAHSALAGRASPSPGRPRPQPAPPPRPQPAPHAPPPEAARAAWPRRAWQPIASDLGVHGLAYLGVLLMFAGTLGLALFSLRSVNTSLRPLAEVALPLVLLVSSWFLGRRGTPLVAASLELLGGAVLPILAFASLLDGSSVPPDLAPGLPLVVALSAIAVALALAYALVARRRPTTTLRYLVAPLCWTAVGVLGLAFQRGPSAAQMALVSAAVTATLLAARRWPRHRLSLPTALASIPGAALAIALVLAFAAAEGWPLWPPLAATAATLVTIDLLASRFPAATLATPAQSLALGTGLAAVAPQLGWATSGAILVAGTLLLLEWHARRRPEPVVALVVLAVAAAGLAMAMAAPWTAVAAAAAATAWAHARRIRPLPGPLGRSAEWAAGLAVAACLAPLALASGLERALPHDRAWVVLACLTVAAALAVRRWRPADKLYVWLVPALAALAALGTVGEWLVAPSPAPAGWLAVAAGLAGAAVALTPGRPAPRAWAAAPVLAWSLALWTEAAGVSPTARPLLWAALGLALVATATAWRGGIAGHLAVIGHLVGLGALAAAGLPESGAAGTAVLAAWWAAWLLAAVAAELGVAPLVGLLARIAGEGTWPARAARAVPALMVAAGLPPLVLMAVDLRTDGTGVSGDWLRAVLGGWGALLLLGGLLLDGLRPPRRGTGRWLLQGSLDALVALGALDLAAAIALAAGEPPAVLAAWCLAGAACTLLAAWRRGWPWALASVALTLLGAAVAGPGWLALTALLAGAAACAVAALVRAGRVMGNWATPGWLLAAAAIAATAALIAGWAPGATAGVPSGLLGLETAGAIALLAAAAGLAAAPLGLPSLRPASGLLAFGAGQVLLAAGRTPADRWALATMALAAAATANCLALWWARRRSGWTWGASWLGALVPLAGAAAVAGLLAAAVDGRRGLLAAGLLVGGLEAAAGGLVLASPGLARLAPPLACGAWLELTAEALGGDPQWLTVPIGLTLLVVVEMSRAQLRAGGKPLTRELRLLEHAGMLLVVGAALVQTVTRATTYGLVASLLAIGLCVWGAATRVRRRVVAGSVTLLLALFGMIVVPVAQIVPEFRGAALWIVLTAVGLLLVTVAVSLEQGRARLASAVGRIDRLMRGWE